jgi:hypothetical protein
VEVTSTIRVHYWIPSGSVIPLPPVFARVVEEIIPSQSSLAVRYLCI